nr:hypothetical protein Cplu_556 [Cedratvirus plubellavi]
MNSLPGELLLCVAEHMCYVDILSLRRTCSYYRDSLPCPNFRKLLVEKLQPYSSDAEKIVQEIDKSGAVIAGSFILHVLYDSVWQPNDIDIFEGSRSWGEYKYQDMPFCSQMLTFTNMGYVDCHRYEYLPSFLTRMYKSKHEKELLFNHIPIGYVSPMRFIYYSFDMDLVKVAYHKGKLYVKNWNKLIQRKDLIVPASLALLGKVTSPGERWYKEVALEKMEYRKNKYQERGFSITETDKKEELLDETYEMFTCVREGRFSDHRKNLVYYLKSFKFNYYLNPEEPDERMIEEEEQEEDKEGGFLAFLLENGLSLNEQVAHVE